jgi:hypothetical protein
MVMNNDLLQVGDWVKGKLKDGELVHGFIASLDPIPEKVKINIVSSDNEKVIGKTVELMYQKVEKLPLAPDRENQLRSLIDLALLTGDHKWFMELTDSLNSLIDASKTKEKPVFPLNRFKDTVQKSKMKE